MLNPIPMRAAGAFRLRVCAALAGGGLVAAVLATASCGGGSPTTPTPPTPPAPPALTSVAPNSGPTAGGTQITLTGSNFTAGAGVTVGGAAATSVNVDSATTIRAVTPARAAGTVDVVITIGSQSATLPGGYTYVAPVPNTPPTITGITVQGTRPNQPASFADLDEEVVVTATARDAETPEAELIYEWSAGGGTFSGAGAQVRWRAPRDIDVPTQLTITLKVTDREPSAGALGAALPAAVQSATMSVPVRVHSSAKEITDLSIRFLEDFSDSSIPPATVVRDFWDGCRGKQEELDDVTYNRENYRVVSHRIDPPTVAVVNFGGVCDYIGKNDPKPADGCVVTPVRWVSILLNGGRQETVWGDAQTTAVYRASRWWLCDSNFTGEGSSPRLPSFMR